MDNTAIDNTASEWVARVAEWVREAGILNEDVEAHVLHAFSRVPRAPFVDPAHARFALGDTDLPVAHGQWLWRPSLLIRFAGLINLQKRMRILVLGAGSGYLCAALSAAGAQVFGVESIGALAQSSRKHLDASGFHGVVVQRGDGNKGWEDAGPFDAIIVAYKVENDLDLPLGQMRVGGTLVAPVVSDEGARLTVWRKSAEGFKRTVFEEVMCK